MDRYFMETGAKLSNMTDRQREKAKFTKEEATMHKLAKLALPLTFPKERVIVQKKR